MPTKPPAKTSKLASDLQRILPHVQMEAAARARLDGCQTDAEALDHLEEAGLLDEAARLVAHALPPREAVWWACACALHTSPSGADPQSEAVIRPAAEAWMRQPSDELRRTAMKDAEKRRF